MKSNNKSILFSEIRAIRNVRTTHTNSVWLADGRFLVPSIIEEGMQERIWVTPIYETNEEPAREDGEPIYYELVRGHSRCDAAGIMQVENPEDFARIFPGGKIKCQVITDLVMTDKINEKERLKMDFNRRNLEDDYELQLAVNLLFDSGCTEAEVANQLASMLGSITGDKKAKIAEYEAKLAEDETTIVERMDLQKAITELVSEYRRGKIQGKKSWYSCPYIVMDCLYLKTYGKMPDHYESGAFLPVLTGGEVRKLAAKFRADLKEYAETGNGTRPTKMVGGLQFAELFESICVVKRNKIEVKKSGPTKSMSRENIIKPIADGKLESSAMESVLKYHGADKSVDPSIISSVDNTLAIVEFAQKEMPLEWAQIEDAYTAHMKLQVAASVAQAQREGEEL